MNKRKRRTKEKDDGKQWTTERTVDHSTLATRTRIAADPVVSSCIEQMISRVCGRISSDAGASKDSKDTGNSTYLRLTREIVRSHIIFGFAIIQSVCMCNECERARLKDVESDSEDEEDTNDKEEEQQTPAHMATRGPLEFGGWSNIDLPQSGHGKTLLVIDPVEHRIAVRFRFNEANATRYAAVYTSNSPDHPRNDMRVIIFSSVTFEPTGAPRSMISPLVVPHQRYLVAKYAALSALNMAVNDTGYLRRNAENVSADEEAEMLHNVASAGLGGVGGGGGRPRPGGPGGRGGANRATPVMEMSAADFKKLKLTEAAANIHMSEYTKSKAVESWAQGGGVDMTATALPPGFAEMYALQGYRPPGASTGTGKGDGQGRPLRFIGDMEVNSLPVPALPVDPMSIAEEFTRTVGMVFGLVSVSTASGAGQGSNKSTPKSRSAVTINGSAPGETGITSTNTRPPDQMLVDSIRLGVNSILADLAKEGLIPSISVCQQPDQKEMIELFDRGFLRYQPLVRSFKDVYGFVPSDFNTEKEMTAKLNPPEPSSSSSSSSSAPAKKKKPSSGK